MLECPLNPPILGDFDVFSPQNWGAGGAQFDFCKRSIVGALVSISVNLSEKLRRVSLGILVNAFDFAYCEIV